MNTFLIALGSNLGDRKYYIDQAIEAIGRLCGKVTKTATIMESEPLGAADQSFFNTALLCDSQMEPEQMLKTLLEIETQLGRTRGARWGNRTIDCDIILWRSKEGTYPIFVGPSLLIPHPEALNRDFVLKPAAEIAAEWIHPKKQITLGELWRKFEWAQET